MRDGLQGRSYLEELDCLGTVSLVKTGGLREFSMVDGFVVDGLVEAEKRKGSGMRTGILEAGSTGRANTTNGVKQGTSRATDSKLTFSCSGNSSTQA